MIQAIQWSSQQRTYSPMSSTPDGHRPNSIVQFYTRSRLTFMDWQQTIDERKGYLFEQFVVTLFDREYFTLLEWRSDKCIDGIFPLTCQFPDLEFYFHSQSETLHFAVESQMASIFYQWNCRVVERNAIGESQTVWENHTNSCFYSVGDWWLFE